VVNMWIGYSYMFLVISGALTSIPEDLKEASFVDGASAFKTFRSIVLPLLLVSVSPLLIASFSFNFNNFTLVQLLTGGGPFTGSPINGGQTDLLITYTFRLAFGIGDFRRDTGFGENPATLAYARSRFTIAAKAAHLPGPIDGPTVGSSALKLSEATAVSAEFGMTGKICLTPDQCPTVNEGLSPSQEEITWAKEFFAEYERDGGEIRNGSDLPRIARANKILDLARAYGIEVSEFDDQAVHVTAPSDTYHY